MKLLTVVGAGLIRDVLGPGDIGIVNRLALLTTEISQVVAHLHTQIGVHRGIWWWG